MSIFFIADTHFGDENIILYENRPFKNAEEADRAIIKNWNSTVSPSDTVFLAGDFSSYGKEKNAELCGSLNGKKILVMGNHDAESEEYYRECGFDSAYSFPIVYGGFWIISHEPMYMNVNMPYANIFGHVHANPSYKDFSSHSFCVSAERISYTPISLEQIKKAVSGQK